MILQSHQSKNILATSDNLTDVINNPSEYLQVDIKLQHNCCPEIYEDSLVITPTKIWNVDVLKPSDTRHANIKGVYLKNFDNGEVFSIGFEENFVSILTCADFDAVTAIINDYIANNFPSPEPEPEPEPLEGEETGVTSTCDDTTKEDSFIYGITGLPENIVPIYLDYEFDGVPMMQPFYFVYSGKNSVLTNTALVLHPEIMNLMKFPDGVYKVKVIIIKDSGTQIIESQCFFLDCHTKCDVFEVLPALPDDDKVEILMTHYGLTVGSNCACSCDELCILYYRLLTWLEPTKENCNCV